jgi:hypothetical protein
MAGATRPASPGEPLLVLEGRPGTNAIALAIGLAFGVFVCVSLIFVTEGGVPGGPKLPWILHDSTNFMNQNPGVPLAAIVVSMGVAYAVAIFLLLPAAGRVSVHDDLIVIEKGLLGKTTLAWSQIAAFRDESSAHVQLLRPGETRGSNRLAIPTRTEAGRAHLLDLLDRFGVKRASA